MKRVFGFILIATGITALVRVFTGDTFTGHWEIIGGIIGISVLCFLPAYFLIREKKLYFNKIYSDILTNKHSIDALENIYIQHYQKTGELIPLAYSREKEIIIRAADIKKEKVANQEVAIIMIIMLTVAILSMLIQYTM